MSYTSGLRMLDSVCVYLAFQLGCVHCLASRVLRPKSQSCI